MSIKKFPRIVLGLTLFIIVGSGCRKSDNHELVRLKAEERTDVAYGSHTNNKFDVYLPEGRDISTPVIVFLHGGFWSEGDKSMFTVLARYFQSKGYAAVNMNYRLTGTAENNIHPAQVNDIGKAIDFVSSNAAAWNISSQKFAVLGASAGAHLALLYTYAYNSGDKVKTVISLAGPTNFTDMRNAGPQQALVIQAFLGATFQANPQAYVQASPVTHVSAGSKPTLLFHGKADLVVPYQQSADLKARLDQFNVPNKFILAENVGHELTGIDTDPAFLAECETWLSAYLK